MKGRIRRASEVEAVALATPVVAGNHTLSSRGTFQSRRLTDPGDARAWVFLVFVLHVGATVVAAGAAGSGLVFRELRAVLGLLEDGLGFVDLKLGFQILQAGGKAAAI